MFTFSASKALVENGHAVITSEPLLIAKLGFKKQSQNNFDPINFGANPIGI